MDCSAPSAHRPRAHPQSIRRQRPRTKACLWQPLREASKNLQFTPKKIIDDDDLALHHGPIPRLIIEGSDNTAEIIAAFRRYKQSHTSQQTEQALHDWFDETNDLLTVTQRESSKLRDVREANVNNSNELCQNSGDWQQCQKLSVAEARGARSDRTSMNNDLRGWVTHTASVPQYLQQPHRNGCGLCLVQALRRTVWQFPSYANRVLPALPSCQRTAHFGHLAGVKAKARIRRSID
jgi:hypothetical protein